MVLVGRLELGAQEIPEVDRLEGGGPLRHHAAGQWVDFRRDVWIEEKRAGKTLPATAVAHTLFNAMMASGRGDLDHSAVINIIEDLAKVQARTSGE